MMKCDFCDNEAVYDLDTADDIIHVCESCDEILPTIQNMMRSMT